MNFSVSPKYVLVIATIALIISSCKKEDDSKFTWDNPKGVFVVNEGTTSVSSSVSCFGTGNSKVYNDIFKLVNGLPLGSYAQSIDTSNNNFYIMVGGSNKIEVVKKNDFKSIASISGLNTPRYFQRINSQKAYVSQWGATGTDGTIAVIDLTTNTLKSTISGVGSGSEKMLLLNNMVYIVNAGGYGNDSTVVLIDPSTDAITKSIKVGYNPNSMVVDKNGMIWVLCSGYTNASYSLTKPGALVAINPTTNTVEKNLTFSLLKSPTSLSINAAKDQLVFIYNGAVYQQDITAASLTATAKINRSFYHISIDPSSNILYATDPKDFSSNGLLIRYNNSFSKIDSCTVGVGAGELFFNN
jgi:hypothetical protein